MSRTITVAFDGDIAVITLANPPLNLFGADSFDELDDCLERIERSSARAAVWRADGRLMSGGVDVKVFAEAAERGDGFPSLIEPVSRLESLPIPTLALCHGVCLTAAFEIALACDLIWAGESARFGLVEKVVGLTPGAGGTQRLAARAGVGRASELVMSGETYDAATLREWGVVNRVVPDAELEREGMAFARELAAGPTLAHAATKRILRAFREGGVGAADEITPGEFSGLFASEDLRGAVRSFLEDGPGKATFRGR